MPVRIVGHGNMPAAGGRFRLKGDIGRFRKTESGISGNIPVSHIVAVEEPPFEEPERLYGYIAEVCSVLMNAARVSLMLPERGVLRIKGMKGIDKAVAKKVRVKAGEGISGTVYREGKPFIVKASGECRSAQGKADYREGSFVSMPLKIGNETIGVLNLADRADGLDFSGDDMKVLRNLASFVSLVIEGAECCKRLEELKTLSVTDGLTGLFNRRYFDERFSEELSRAARYDSFLSLAILDIDDFKLFNDTEGHLAGDDVLKAMSHIASESLRAIDIIARYGGEEFAIIMPETEKEEAVLVAERARRNFEELMAGRWESFPRRDITVSIGVASFPGDGRDAETIIRHADKALYGAKIGGKNRTVTWRGSL